MCFKRKASVQDDTKETRRDVDANFLSINEDSGLPSAVVGPSGERTCLIFVSVQI